AERAAQAYSQQIINFDGGGLETASCTSILANSLGFAGEYQSTLISLVAVPVAADDQGHMQRDYWYDHRRRLKELAAPEEIGRIAAQRTLRKMNGRSVPTQSVPVVFDPNMAASLLANLFEAVSGE